MLSFVVPGPEEVERRGERRPDAEPERAAHAAEARHLDEARPEERLLERRVLEDPRPEPANVPSPGVKRQKNIQPSTNSASLTAWKR
jgi:hypothetical protein